MIDWSERYRARETPWNLGGAHPDLVRRLGAGELGPRDGSRSVLVPGCGHGHDALALAGAGLVVTAVDIVHDLRDHLEEKLAALGGSFAVADALALEGMQFDLVFDHTFFCAIDPSRRADWGAMIRRVLRPGGALAALVYPFSKPIEAGGPPWGVSRDAIEAAVGAGFESVADEEVVEKGHQTWPERWLVMRRV